MKIYTGKENVSIVLEDYLDYLQGTKNYSIHTIKTYNCCLLSFFYFIIQYKEFKIELINLSLFELLQIEKPDVIAFLVYLNYHKTNVASSRQNRLSIIRSFYKWLLVTNTQFQKINPAKEIPNVEPALHLPKYLTLEQAKKIQQIFTLKNSKTPIRNNTIITLFLSTGVRVSELIGININDINFDKNSIKIKGKRNKQRTVYFSDYCKKELKKYISIRIKNKKIKDSDALFISLQNKRIGIDGVEDICQKAYKLMGLENQGLTTHSLRHTAATILYKYSNQDILLVKEFLGHAEIGTTKIYTHCYNDEIRQCIEKNPLKNFKKRVGKREDV